VVLPETPRAGDSLFPFNSDLEYLVVKSRFRNYNSRVVLLVIKAPLPMTLSGTMDPRGESTSDFETAGWAEHLEELTGALSVAEPFNPTKQQL